MGMSKAIYLGPYVRADRKVIENDYPDRVCPNGHDFSDPHAEFCSQCGARIETVRVPSNEEQSLHLILEEELHMPEWEDVMMCWDSGDGADLLVPNRRGFGTHLDEVNQGEVIVDNEDPWPAMQEMEKQYGDFIEAVTPHYEKVDVRFGIVIWYW
jgi:hypothetical protein